jgi:DNA-binding NarL/FixJ family response regulator
VSTGTQAILFERDPFNRRFIRAAIRGCGYTDIVEAFDLEAFVKEAADRQPDLLVLDPAVEEGAGMQALTDAAQAAPAALAIALSSDTELLAQAVALGMTAVKKVSVVKLDPLREAIAPGSSLGVGAGDFVPSDDEISTLRVKLNEEFTVAPSADAEAAEPALP